VAAPPQNLAEGSAAAAFLPESKTLAATREAAKVCTACPLHVGATQTVFGEGPASGTLAMLVGEQPGDQEDKAGHPFVGPAGRLLDEALEEAGIDRARVYVTNTVKHFKFTQRGKRRLHEKPNAIEIKACGAWLQREIELVKPPVIVALGSTAAQAFLGKSFRITKQHGEWIRTPWTEHFLATAHPSSILRMPDSDARAKGRAELVADLRVVEKKLAELGALK
jgi:uracil-DNA glycosylase